MELGDFDEAFHEVEAGSFVAGVSRLLCGVGKTLHILPEELQHVAGRLSGELSRHVVQVLAGVRELVSFKTAGKQVHQSPSQPFLSVLRVFLVGFCDNLPEDLQAGQEYGLRGVPRGVV